MDKRPSAHPKNVQEKSTGFAPETALVTASGKARRVVSRSSPVRRSLPEPPPLHNSLTIPDLERAVEDWLLDGEARLSPKTVVDRRFLTEKLLWWLRLDGHTQCGKSEMMRFFAYLRTAHEKPEGRWGEPGTKAKDKRCTKPLRPRTPANYFRWLRTFFLYLVEAGTLDESPLKTLKPPTHRDDQVQPFSQKQVAALFKAAQQSRNPKRDEAILYLLLDTGARVGEVATLRFTDFNLRERSVRVLGKGNTHRDLPMTPQTTRAINIYLRGEQRDDDGPLFTSVGGFNIGEAMTSDGIGQIIARLGRVAGISGVRCSPHTFRHTFAIEFLRNGGDPLTLQSLYGHTSLEMTRKYVLFSQADRKSKHAKYSPVAHMKKPR